jgi:hypothetical protein
MNSTFRNKPQKSQSPQQQQCRKREREIKSPLNFGNRFVKTLFERSGGGNCEAISDVAERVLNFSILYTHNICGGVINFDFAY